MFIVPMDNYLQYQSGRPEYVVSVTTNYGGYSVFLNNTEIASFENIGHYGEMSAKELHDSLCKELDHMFGYSEVDN